MFGVKYTEEQIENKRRARKFSVPYNNDDPIQYIRLVVDPYINNIDSLYFEIPNPYMRSHINTSTTDLSQEHLIAIKNTTNLAKLLRLDSKYAHIKKYITLNSASYMAYDVQYKHMCIDKFVKPLFEEKVIDGVICADYEMALFIKEAMPEIEIQTSCNTYQWLPNTTRRWLKSLDVTTHNPPREILRCGEMLQYVRNHLPNLRLKCIVNEGCEYGCPRSVNCAHYAAYGYEVFHTHCHDHNFRSINEVVTSILRTNFILPRWLKYYDDYVDVFKICGRQKKTRSIAFRLDAYVNERDDVSLESILSNRWWKRLLIDGFQTRIEIPVNMIPDYLMSCQCDKCDDGCKVCEGIVCKVLQHNNIDTSIL